MPVESKYFLKELLQTGSVFEKAFFLFLNGLSNSWKLILRLQKTFKTTDFCVLGNFNTNLQRITEKIKSINVVGENTSGAFRMTDMVGA